MIILKILAVLIIVIILAFVGCAIIINNERDDNK